MIRVNNVSPDRSARVGLVSNAVNSHQTGPGLCCRTGAGYKESVGEVRIIQTLLLVFRFLMMGYFQGVISQPDIVIFSRTVGTTGSVFIIKIFNISFFIYFSGALILYISKY